MPRPYTQKDMARAADYVNRYWPGVPGVTFQAPIYDVRGTGVTISSPKELMAYARIFSRADILIPISDDWVLVECKSNAQLRELSNLDFYEDALRHDIMRRLAPGAKVRRVFVTDREDARLREACQRMNIEYVVI